MAERKEAREELVMSIVREKGLLTTNEAVSILGVSEATVRRLFSQLEAQSKVVRNYGGIQLALEPRASYSFDLREKCSLKEKKSIGKLAASLVEEGDTIYLDYGTTVFQMTLALSARIAAGELTSLNIITNSMANVQVIPAVDSCCIILVGGRYYHDRRDFAGSITERFLHPFHFSKCFLGCDGINVKDGYFSSQIDTADLDRTVTKHSDRVIMLADSRKFNRASMISFAASEDADVLITDKLPDSVLLRALREAGVEFMIAEN